MLFRSVDPLGILAARRRGGGDGGEKSAGLRHSRARGRRRKGRLGFGERELGLRLVHLLGLPLPSFYRWKRSLGRPRPAPKVWESFGRFVSAKTYYN